MADEPTRRVAQLPGFDTSPDVYETPDLDDSTTTTSTLQTSPREASSASETSDEEDTEGYGVSRRRLFPRDARSRFSRQSKGVDAKGTDLSDRVDGKRRGLKIRRTSGGDEEEEGLEARLARLRREVEECRALVKEQQEQDDGEVRDGQDGEDDVEALSRLLAGIDVPSKAEKLSGKGHRRGASETGQVFHDALPTASNGNADGEADEDEHTLNRITAFDTRLAALETTLGLSAVLDPTSTNPDILSTPLLPTLTLLDAQLATLTSASSLSNLEAASSRIAKLKLEAQNLQSAYSAQQPTPSEHSDDEESTQPSLAHLAPEDAKKLEGLYTLLPTLQALAPTVPALVTRLRSLRTLHTTAATAAGDLDAIEQRQSELDRELKMWREGLEKVEKAVKEADTANGRNGNFVKGWVEDLEGRVKGLGR